jgi:hypothetical protein
MNLKRAFFKWLPFAAVVTALCGLTYVSVQQSLRQAADDPQIQLAEDGSAALERGTSPAALTAGPPVEFSTSLAPFVMVFDRAGRLVASSGSLHGQLPDFPLGVLQAAQGRGEARVTWQPAAGVRVAAVAVPYSGGYVVSGRNLREVEAREGRIELLAGLAWLVAAAGTFIVIALVEALAADR